MDLLNLAGEESLDIPDLRFGFNDVPTGLLNELTGNLLQGQGDGSIISGFVPAAASTTGPVTIGQAGVRNVALLGYQTGQGVTYGVFSAGGAASQSLDISTYAAGTYIIYVRFNRSAAEPQTRTFWSGIDLAEYSKTTNTRLSASWEVRIEVAQPAPEWMAIGQAVVTSQGGGQGNAVVVTDQRPLYFEGSYSTSYKPAWGSAADRGIRRAATITNLRQMIDALKQCLVDIKGANTARWFDSYITGMNIGSGFAATAAGIDGRLALGDTSFYLQGSSSSPTLAFDGPDNSIRYGRGSQFITTSLSGQSVTLLGQNGLALGANIPNLVSPVQPLTVWGNGPSGRVAQFAHSGSGLASISIGTTSNAGARIDFAPGSLSDFTSSPWSIACRNVNPNDFSIGGSRGLILMSLMNDPTYGWSTTLQANSVFLNALSSDGLVYINKMAPGPSFYPYDEGATAFLTAKYNRAPRRAFFTGFGLPAGITYSSGTFTLSFSRPLPTNAIIMVSPGNNNVSRTVSYQIIDTTTVRVIVWDGSLNQIDDSFNVIITYGALGAGSAVSG